MKKITLTLITLILFTSLVFGEENNNTNNNNVNVNVNFNTEELKKELGIQKDVTAAGFGIGITTPIFGTYHDIVDGNTRYTKSMTGINMMFGFTRRNYLGEGLPTNGGAGFFEFGTIMFFVPFAGIGYDYKVSENFLIGTGLPDVLHFSIKF